MPRTSLDRPILWIIGGTNGRFRRASSPALRPSGFLCVEGTVARFNPLFSSLRSRNDVAIADEVRGRKSPERHNNSVRKCPGF